MNSLKDINKWVQFYKAAAVQPTYWPKRELLHMKILINMLRVAYLELGRTSAIEHSYKNF